MKIGTSQQDPWSQFRFWGSKIGMSRQNRDTWQIWALIPVIIISILGNIVLSIFILVLRNFVGPTFRFFVILAIKTRVLRVKNITTRQTQSGNPRKRGEFLWMTYITLPIGLCLHVLRNIKRLLLRRSPDLRVSPDFFSAIKWCYDARNNEKNMSSWVEIYNWTP